MINIPIIETNTYRVADRFILEVIHSNGAYYKEFTQMTDAQHHVNELIATAKANQPNQSASFIESVSFVKNLPDGPIPKEDRVLFKTTPETIIDNKTVKFRFISSNPDDVINISELEYVDVDIGEYLEHAGRLKNSYFFTNLKLNITHTLVEFDHFLIDDKTSVALIKPQVIVPKNLKPDQSRAMSILKMRYDKLPEAINFTKKEGYFISDVYEDGAGTPTHTKLLFIITGSLTGMPKIYYVFLKNEATSGENWTNFGVSVSDDVFTTPTNCTFITPTEHFHVNLNVSLGLKNPGKGYGVKFEGPLCDVVTVENNQLKMQRTITPAKARKGGCVPCDNKQKLMSKLQSLRKKYEKR